MGGSRYRRLLRLFGARDRRAELDEELDTHASLRAHALEATGLDPARAREEARRRLGDRDALYASARLRDGRLRRREWLESLCADVGLALRRARRAPGATAVTLLTYALGIGLTTAGFTVVDGVLLRALPYPDAQRIVALYSVTREGRPFPLVAAAAWRDWREGAPSAATSALHQAQRFTVSTGETAWRVPGQAVAGPFFDVVGSPMLRGRAFTEGEVAAGGRLAVVSEAFWRTALGGAIELPGALVLDGVPHVVTGVVPDGRGYPAATQVWVGQHPLELTHDGAYNLINWHAIARLPPGTRLVAVRAELDAVAHRIREARPGALYSWGVSVTPLRDLVVGDSRLLLAMLGGAVLLVLLIACANIAGLGLAQGTTRADEMRVRVSLGASHGRLVRQLLTEQIAAACLGAVAGLVLAVGVIRVVSLRAAAFLPRSEEIGLDPRALGFALLLTLTAGLAAGLLPALRTSGMRPGGDRVVRGGVRGGRRLPAAALVGGELALALVLVYGTALLARSSSAVASRDLGFRTENIVAADVSLTSPAYTAEPARTRFWDELRTRLEAQPGIARVAFAHSVPGDAGGMGFVDVANFAGDAPVAGYRVISHGYLELLGVPLLQGRRFDATDRAGSPRVAIVNGAMAERYWPDGTAVGGAAKAVSMEGHIGADWLTVVGVVGNIRHYGFAHDTPDPEMYVLDVQVPAWTHALFVVAEGTRSADETRGAVARTIHAMDPTLAADYATLESRVTGPIAARRFTTTGIGLFAGLALLLAAIGLYGLLAFAVARQIREMGVRAALGARRSGLIRLVLARAARIMAFGAAAGLATSFALSRLVRALLVDVAPTDPASTLAALLVLLAIGLVTAAVPAWRAARTDPLEALRAE